MRMRRKQLDPNRPSMTKWFKKALLIYFGGGLLLVIAIFLYSIWPSFSAI